MPIRFVVVSTNHRGRQKRYFLRREQTVRQIVQHLDSSQFVVTIQVILLCPDCGEEEPHCICTPKQIAANVTLQAVQ